MELYVEHFWSTDRATDPLFLQDGDFQCRIFEPNDAQMVGLRYCTGTNRKYWLSICRRNLSRRRGKGFVNFLYFRFSLLLMTYHCHTIQFIVSPTCFSRMFLHFLTIGLERCGALVWLRVVCTSTSKLYYLGRNETFCNICNTRNQFILLPRSKRMYACMCRPTSTLHLSKQASF